LKTSKKNILVIYHSQDGTLEILAKRLVKGAAKEENITVTFKKAADVRVGTINDGKRS